MLHCALLWIDSRQGILIFTLKQNKITARYNNFKSNLYSICRNESNPKIMHYPQMEKVAKLNKKFNIFKIFEEFLHILFSSGIRAI